MFKKLLLIALIALSTLGTACLFAEGSYESGTQKNTNAAYNTATASASMVPVPMLSYFPERQTIARWAKMFDQPSITCYLYLIDAGNIIGYYVTNGKPASTRSYLTPETDIGYNGGTKELADIDGTYGTNNPGIRFFTASGTAVEWGGYGTSYLFSTAKIPGNFTELGN
jgi:hypothetical protein